MPLRHVAGYFGRSLHNTLSDRPALLSHWREWGRFESEAFVNPIYETPHTPINSTAARVAGDKLPLECLSVKEGEELIMGMLERQGEVKIQIAEIDVELSESSERFHKYGLKNPDGWFRKKKLEIAQLKSQSTRLGFAIDTLRRKITAIRFSNVAEAFMVCAREVLSADTFHEILKRAEMAKAVGTSHFKESDK